MSRLSPRSMADEEIFGRQGVQPRAGIAISIAPGPNRPVLIKESDPERRLFRKVQPLRRH
jgi:hypothetical protein